MIERMRLRDNKGVAGPVVERTDRYISIEYATTEIVTRTPESFEPDPPPERPKGEGWRLYRCVNAEHAPYLDEGGHYWLRRVSHDRLEDVGATRFARFRFVLPALLED